MALTRVNPDDVFFTFSRLRPQFSCGRRVEDTLNSILAGDLRPEDLPPIGVLLDPATGHLFSLNNRRLYVFKALKAAGRLSTVPVRIKPVPQTKRMTTKYTAEKCAKVARLMLEREAVEALGSASAADGPEGVNSASDEDEDSDNNGSDEEREGGSKAAASASKRQKGGPSPAADDGAKKPHSKKGSAASAAETDKKVEAKGDEEEEKDGKRPAKYVKPQRNMDDWTDSEDEGGKGGKKGNKKGTRKK